MSVTAVGSLGTGNDKNSSGVTVTVTPARTVPVGNLLVAWVAWDSVFSVFDPNNGEGGFQMFDTQGNVWTNIGACTDTQGFFATGAWAGVFVTQVTNELTTSDTITVSATHVGNLIAKAVSIEEFDIGGVGFRWAQAPLGYDFARTVADDPPTQAFDMQHNREWLEIHCLGSEGPDTDSFTWDADWVEITGDGTTGGADDSNVCVRGGYRIATEQTTSASVSNDTAARDNSQVMTALAITEATVFPNTPILDDFNRADEYPVDGGLWNTVNEAFGSAFLPLVSNGTDGSGGSFFGETWVDCAEAYITITQYTGQPMLDIMAAGDTTVPSKTGTGLAWALLVDSKPVVADVILFGNCGNQGSVERGHCFVWVAGADDVKWGLQRTRETFGMYATRLWMDRGSGWEELAAIVLTSGDNSIGAAAVSAYTTGPGGSPPKQDDFGGGEIPCLNPKTQRQIMRYR